MLKQSITTLTLLGSVLLVSQPGYAQDWTFELEPYGLAASIEGDAGIGRVTGAPVDVGFDSILENLDMAFMGHFEAHNSNGWGVVLDYGFMDLGADISTPRDGVVDASIRQGTFEALGMYRNDLPGGTLDVTFGIRWWDNDIDTEIDPAVLPGTVESNIEEDWVDIIVGARWISPINNRWSYLIRGDVGGFGLEADFTGSLAAGFVYQMSDSWQLDMQYRGLWVDYEDGSAGDPGYFAYDTVTHGPLVGFIYKF